MGDLTENFSRVEFQCACCGRSRIKLRLVRRLQRARETAEVPFVITSGYRCDRHNEELVKQGKAVKGSAHTKGMAADIRAENNRKRFLIVGALLKAGFRRLGLSEKYIHADIDKGKPTGVMWLYSKGGKV